MLDLDLDIQEVVENMRVTYPRFVDRASRSALASLGYELGRDLKDKIRRGTGWPAKRTNFRQKRGMKWWSKFIRYKVFDEQANNLSSGRGVQAGAAGQTLVIRPGATKSDGWADAEGNKLDLRTSAGKAYKASGGQLYRRLVDRPKADKFVAAVFRRFETGKLIRVTARMRWRLLADGLPLKKSTKTLYFAPRPIFKPVWSRQGRKAPAFFTRKFFDNLNRYLAGVTASQWKNSGGGVKF